MKSKCLIAAAVASLSLIIIFLSLILILQQLHHKIDENNKKITKIESMLSELQIEKIEYVED